jgi:hypothetical protein
VQKWVSTSAGVPTEADFGTTQGQGTPLVINEVNDRTYYLKAGVVTPTAIGGGGGSTPTGTGFIHVTAGVQDGAAALVQTADITDGNVTLIKLANMATASLYYRKTAGAGAPEVQTLATLKTDLGLTGTNSGDQTITLTGDVTGSGTGSFAATIGANAVSFAKFVAAPSAGFVGATGAGNYVHRTPTEVTAALDVATTSLQGLLSSADKIKLDADLTPVAMTADAAARGAAIADYFATTLSLEASSTYDIECHAHFLKTTAGTVVWTWLFSNAPTMVTSRYEATPITGYTGAVVTGAPVQAQATSKGTATNAHAASGSLTTAVDHSFIFWVRIRTNAATTVQLRSTESAGTITPRAGSYMRARKII